jgi:hypothetical protein
MGLSIHGAGNFVFFGGLVFDVSQGSSFFRFFVSRAANANRGTIFYCRLVASRLGYFEKKERIKSVKLRLSTN